MSCDRRCFLDPDAKEEYECQHCPGRDALPQKPEECTGTGAGECVAGHICE
jgi:hypothetical protein